jgi:transcriptional regulator with XRE-family HTH domain
VKKIRDEKLMADFGSHVRKLRMAQGLSMEKLAELAEIEYSQISKIERGLVNTTISSSNALAKGLNIELHTLFNFK